jgi:hypothetical protein
MKKKGKQQQQKQLQISAHIKRNGHFLKSIAHCRSRERCAHLLSSAGPEQLLCLVECCLNLLAGRVPIAKRKLKRLQAYASEIRALSKARTPVGVRRRLQQTGGGLPLIPIVVSALLPIIIERAIESINATVDEE